MTAYLLAGPATEPLTLAEARAFLRVDGPDEDSFISTLITAARLHCESVTGRAMISQSWRIVRDAWPSDRKIRLPVAPLRSLTAVRAFDADGNVTALAPGDFQPGTGKVPAFIFVPAFISGMPAIRAHDAIEIDYVAGYGDAPEDVPQDLRHALLTLVGTWFEHRDAVIVAGSGTVVPVGFDRLVEPYKAVRL